MSTPSASMNRPLRLAMPVANGRLHDHFGGCREFAMVEADSASRKVLAVRSVPAPPHQPGLFPRWLREQGVTTVIVGGIGRRALDIFAQHGITVREGWTGASVEELANAYLDGQLTKEPDACEHHGHHDDPAPHRVGAIAKR